MHTRHVRASRAVVETYVKFKIASNTGAPVNGNVGYKLVEVSGNRELMFKNGSLNTSNKEVSFTGMKLNTTYKMYITSVPNGFDRPVLSVAEFYFDTDGIHFTKGSGGIVLTQNSLLGLNLTVNDSSGNPITKTSEVKFELKRVVPGGEVSLNTTAKPGGSNRVALDINRRDVYLGDQYKLYVTQVPSGYQKPEVSVSDFTFSYEYGKLFVRFSKGGTAIVLKKVGEQDKPLAANEYYGFVGYGDKIKVSKNNDSATGVEAFCINVNRNFPSFGGNAVYKEFINNADELYSAVERPRVNKKELYDAVRKIYYYCETHKEELLKDYGLNDESFWRDVLDHDQDHGYYKALQEEELQK